MGLAKLPSKRRLELRSANGRRFFGCRTARGNLISIVLICLALEAVAGRHIAFDLRSISSPFEQTGRDSMALSSCRAFLQAQKKPPGSPGGFFVQILLLMIYGLIRLATDILA